MNTPNNDCELRKALETLRDFVEPGSRAEAIIDEALSKSPRNCDVFRTRDACDKAYDRYSKHYMRKHARENDFGASCLDYEDWFLAEYEPECYVETEEDKQ